MMLKKYNISFILILKLLLVFGQDTQFSQYYASFVYLNPALSGTIDKVKMGVQYRSQWKNANALYTSSLGYAAIASKKRYSSFNLMYQSNNQGFGVYKRDNLALGYAFSVPLTPTTKFILGTQAAYVSERLDYAKLTFGDQLTDEGATNNTLEQFDGPGNNTFYDFNTGVLLYGKKAFIGFAASHLTEPSYGFGNPKSILPRKYVTHAGWVLAQNNEASKRWLLTTLVKNQDKYDQMDAGTYLDLRYISIGAWYRGLPIVKNYKGIANNESIIGMFGMKIKKINISYSYDYVLSGLSTNAHEISVFYEFRIDKKQVEPKLGLPIPMF